MEKKQPKISRDRPGRTELHYAAASIEDSSSYVAYLLAAGFDPNDRDHAGVTPLHAAVEHHHIDTVRTLLDAGADVNARDSQGDTPLYYAFRSPWSTASLVQLLRDRGADPHLPNNRGNTPLAFVGMLSNKPELRAVFADLLDDEPA